VLTDLRGTSSFATSHIFFGAPVKRAVVSSLNTTLGGIERPIRSYANAAATTNTENPIPTNRRGVSSAVSVNVIVLVSV
jgi:hypothetical protein